jgi:hypothetical protein
MSAIKRVEGILKSFVDREIPLDELLLHLEPILVESAPDRRGQDEVRKIVNAIERTIYTENEPTRSDEITALLRNAVEFIRARQSA